MITAEDTRREKAKKLRYKKPIVKDINLWQIREDLEEMAEACDEVRYYWETDDDTLLNALDGDEDEAYEFKMALADLKMAVSRAKRERKKVGRRGRKRKEGRGGKDT